MHECAGLPRPGGLKAAASALWRPDSMTAACSERVVGSQRGRHIRTLQRAVSRRVSVMVARLGLILMAFPSVGLARTGRSTPYQSAFDPHSAVGFAFHIVDLLGQHWWREQLNSG